jgi:hypothetical protein
VPRAAQTPVGGDAAPAQFRELVPAEIADGERDAIRSQSDRKHAVVFRTDLDDLSFVELVDRHQTPASSGQRVIVDHRRD